MAKEVVVGSMSDWAGMLSDFFRQIKDGSITESMMQAIVEHRNPFEARKASSEMLPLIADWQSFYKEVFGWDLDFSEVLIPVSKRGFDRLIIVAKGITPETGFQKCKDLFPCWKYTERNLDKIIESKRTSKNGHYAIWVRDRVEADQENKNLSANRIKDRNLKTETLEERELHELKYFKETGEHLDIINITLCAGSRSSAGGVPRARWHGGEFWVHCYYPDFCNDSLRARSVVS